MEVYRISSCNFIKDLSGEGARLYGGRWNSKGFPVVYTAINRSMAAMETLVHITQKNYPSNFCMASIFIPDDLKIISISMKKLPKDWQTIAIHPNIQKIGNDWLQKGRSALLRVPSVIIPQEYNLLINPLHKDAVRIKIKETNPFFFDKRLKK